MVLCVGREKQEKRTESEIYFLRALKPRGFEKLITRGQSLEGRRDTHKPIGLKHERNDFDIPLWMKGEQSWIK